MAADSITTSCGVFHTRKKNHAHSLRVQRRTAALLVAMPNGYCLPSRAHQIFWGKPKVGSKYKMCTVSFRSIDGQKSALLEASRQPTKMAWQHMPKTLYKFIFWVKPQGWALKIETPNFWLS